MINILVNTVVFYTGFTSDVNVSETGDGPLLLFMAYPESEVSRAKWFPFRHALAIFGSQRVPVQNPYGF